MKTKITHWLHGLFSAIITGVSTSGLSALGISAADQLGASVTQLNLKQLAILTACGGVVGMLAYLKQSPLPPEDQQSSGNGLTGLIMAGLLLFTSCGTLAPDGYYAGNKTLYSQDLSLATSYDLLHTYVKWEYDNREQLATVPEVKAYADKIRANAKLWFATALAMRDAYASSPTETNKSAMATAYAVLHEAVKQASVYMTQATATK